MFEAIRNLYERIFQSNRLGGARRSPEWRNVRNEHARVHPRCAVCGKTKIQVHHIVPFNVAPELELEPTNLISLCQGLRTNKCHIFFGHLGNFQSWNTAVRGDATFWKEKRANRPPYQKDAESVQPSEKPDEQSIKEEIKTL